MERDGWDLSGRAAIRLDGLMVGTADRELFNMPLTRLPALCSWAVTFPLGAWNGDIESKPLDAHSLDAALDEVDDLYPMAPWWWPTRGHRVPSLRPYGVLAVDHPAPEGSSPVEALLWRLQSVSPINVWRGADEIHALVSEYDDKLMRILTPPPWQYLGGGMLRAPFFGDLEELKTFLRRHPAPKRPL